MKENVSGCFFLNTVYDITQRRKTEIIIVNTRQHNQHTYCTLANAVNIWRWQYSSSLKWTIFCCF